MAVYPFQAAQIRLLKANKASITISAKYFNYTNVFSLELIVELPEHIGINNHTIKLEKGKLLSYSPIYSLRLVELEMLKAYIKTNLANNFIKLSKSPARAPIFFNCKPNRNFCLCVDYCDFNNLTIKN